MIRFQSFAFTLSEDNQDARLALIDTFDGNTTASPRLLMEDHAENRSLARHTELLAFDRVYSVEAGEYDAAVDDRGDSRDRRTVNLERNQNYVVLRTGDD